MTTIQLLEPFLHNGTHHYEVTVSPLTNEQRLEILALNGSAHQVIATVAAATGLSVPTVEEMSFTDIQAIADHLT